MINFVFKRIIGENVRKMAKKNRDLFSKFILVNDIKYIILCIGF